MLKRTDLSQFRRRFIKKYRLTKHPKDLARLKKLQKAQRSECRKAYHLYLMGILDPDSGNKSKRLYSYVKSLKKDSCSVGPLRDKQGNLQSSAATQATLLNNHICICVYQRGHHDTSRTQPQPLSRHESHLHPHERSGKDATAHQSSQSHWPGRDTCTPTEISCRPASSNANNNLSRIIQPRHRPHCLAPSRCCSRLQKGGPSGTLKLPPYIPHGHLLQTDGTHYAVQHNAPP